MKKHTPKTKLTINTQTIRTLQPRDLAHVAGGITDSCLTTTLTGSTTYKPHG